MEKIKLNTKEMNLLLSDQKAFERVHEYNLNGGIVPLGERTLSDGSVLELKVDRLNIEDISLRFLVGFNDEVNGESIFYSLEDALVDFLSFKMEGAA